MRHQSRQQAIRSNHVGGKQDDGNLSLFTKIPFLFLKKKPIENMIQRAENFKEGSIDELTVSHHNQTNSI